MELLDFLKYGAMGLGLGLALLAYYLLNKEQDRKPEPNKQMLNAIYFFMGFSLILAAFGFGTEVYTARAKANDIEEVTQAANKRIADSQNTSTEEIEKLKKAASKEIEELKVEVMSKDKLSNAWQDKYSKTEMDLRLAHNGLTLLMNVKTGSIDKLKKLNPKTKEYFAQVDLIQNELESIDGEIQRSLKALESK